MVVCFQEKGCGKAMISKEEAAYLKKVKEHIIHMDSWPQSDCLEQIVDWINWELDLK